MIEVNMTREQFEAKAQQLKAEQGIDLVGDKGSIAKSGVGVQYEYSDGVLTLAVYSKPFLVSMGYCESKIREWLGVS